MKFLGRTNSRILAMMIIYNYDINKDKDINQQIDYIVENNNLELNENNELDYDKEFLNKLINGVINKIDYLDYIISLVIEPSKSFFSFVKGKMDTEIRWNSIEKIGKNIDLAMIDTSHFEPGEILDFLLILPFLKDEAIVIFHDIDHQITHSIGKDMRYYWAPYIIFNLIRGKKFYPSGQGVLNKDIGAIKLEKNQKRFIHDYCRALGGHWEYFLSEKHIKMITNFFKKYYDKECLIILNEAITFNRDFVKDNPKENYYDRLAKNIK